MALRRMKRRYQLCLQIVVRCPNGKELHGGTLYRPGLSKDDAMRYARRIMTTIPNYQPEDASPSRTGEES
jgi:hypothetical protein